MHFINLRVLKDCDFCDLKLAALHFILYMFQIMKKRVFDSCAVTDNDVNIYLGDGFSQYFCRCVTHDNFLLKEINKMPSGT